MKWILNILQTEMERPKMYGWFHLLCLAIAFLTIIILSKKKLYSEKNLKVILMVYGIVALILELLKQFSWAFTYENSHLVFAYEWYAFPFQLCTTPIYVSIICLFLKKSKLRDHLLSYLAFITILGSITTAIYPDSCFVSDILVNVHTMYLHLGSLVLSLYLIISEEVKLTKDNLFGAIKVFIIFVFIALLLNVIIYNSNLLHGETFNMFYISPYFISILPIYNIIQENVPYFLYLLIYVISISFGGFIIYKIAKLIKMLRKNVNF